MVTLSMTLVSDSESHEPPAQSAALLARTDKENVAQRMSPQHCVNKIQKPSRHVAVVRPRKTTAASTSTSLARQTPRRLLLMPDACRTARGHA